LEQVAAVFQSVANWIGVPPGITPWELLNSELITATIIGIFGLFLGRKVNRLSEKAEDSVAAAAYERELAGHDVVEDAAIADAEDMDVSVGAAPGRGSSVQAPMAPMPDVFEDTVAAEEGVVGNPLQSEASHVVNAAKRFVDERLEAQKDGRKRRKYENIGKRDYGVRALAAREDGLIDNTQALNVLAIFEMWRPYGTGRKVVTADVVNKMKAHLTEAERLKIKARATGRGKSK
jgi:hypothetical protein